MGNVNPSPQVKRSSVAASGRSLWLLGLLALLGGLLILHQTRFGPGASGDSTSYLMGAENLLAGDGFSRYSGGYEVKPITGFPPMYSFVLTPWPLFGLELVEAARFLNALFLAGSLLLVGYLVLCYTQSLVAAGLAQMLILSRDAIFGWHTWVMSEPLYIFLSLLVVFSFVWYLDQGARWGLVVGGLLVSAATLTRYVGGSLWIAGVASILLLRDTPLQRRLVDAGVFSAGSLLPVGLWLLRNERMAGTLVNRVVSLRSVEPALVRLFLADLSSWFVPHEVPLPTTLRALLALVIMLGLGLLILIRWIRSERTSSNLLVLEPTGGRRYRGLVWVLVAAIGSYLAAIAVNSLLLDASTTPGAVPRYLAPAYVLTVMLGSTVASDVSRDSSARLPFILLASYAFILFALNARVTSNRLLDPVDSLGYMGHKLDWQEVVQQLDGIPDDEAILSNNPEQVYILAGRPAYVRPISYDHYQESAREDYDRQLRWARDIMKEGAVFVAFRPVEGDDQAFIQFAGLEAYHEFPEAVFYRLPTE